jgi:PAS domain-containing protein
MARRTRRPAPTAEHTLTPAATACVACGCHLYCDYATARTITSLAGVARYTLRVRRCRHRPCDLYAVPIHPEAEGRLALPHHEFGLDVIAYAGNRRYAAHRTAPEIHAELTARGVTLSVRAVTDLLHRFDELRALAATDPDRLRPLFGKQGRVVLAIDGLQPDVGHEVLWVVRDVLSGRVVVAKTLLSGTGADLAALLRRAAEAVGVPVAGVISDGQHSIRNAAAEALPGVPHQLCQFHYLREAAGPVYEADRHAKKELKKHVRGVREVERRVEDRTDPPAEVVRGYCSAVRAALTDDGRPPLDSAGLRLRDRLTAVADSLGRAGAAKGGRPAS